jgi:hypothetical protein
VVVHDHALAALDERAQLVEVGVLLRPVPAECGRVIARPTR